MLQPLKKIVQKIPKQKSLAASYVGRLWQRYQQFARQNWITMITNFLSIGPCSLILYMFISPLPELPVPHLGGEHSITADPSQARAQACLDTYLQPLKTRNLFKPSIPIPTQKKIGKTTAQQLAERLQFLGISGDEQNLSALVFIPKRGPGSFQVGDRVAEFVLNDIKKNRLVLELQNEQIILKR